MVLQDKNTVPGHSPSAVKIGIADLKARRVIDQVSLDAIDVQPYPQNVFAWNQGQTGDIANKGLRAYSFPFRALGFKPAVSSKHALAVDVVESDSNIKLGYLSVEIEMQANA